MSGEIEVKAKRGRGRPKSVSDETRRAELIAAARELFMSGGYAAMTTDAVAARCQTSKRTVYAHFSGKAELFGAIVDAHRFEMLKLPRPMDDAPLADAIAEIFGVDIEDAADRERHAFVHAAIAEQMQFPEIRALIRTRGVEPSRHALADWLADQTADGRLFVQDPDRTARVLMDLIFGAEIFRPGSRESWPDPESRKAHMRFCIDVFLNGVRRKGPDEEPRISGLT